jgi:transcription-repair coupling factor (superfamily II helicase)
MADTAKKPQGTKDFPLNSTPVSGTVKNPLVHVNHWIEEGHRTMRVAGLSGSARAYGFARFLGDLNKPCLVILPEKKQAERFYREVRFFMGSAKNGNHGTDKRLYRFPPYDMSPLTGLSPHGQLITARINALYALMTEPKPVVITSLEAICFRVMPKTALIDALEYLEAGEEVDREELVKTLEMNGYQHSSMVEERGDYSIRGGVIDVFSPLYPLPVRLEFWGDRLESIRQFDPISQRSENSFNELTLLPACEITKGTNNIKRARSMGRLPGPYGPNSGFPGQEAWLNHFYESPDTLMGYLPENSILTLMEPGFLEPNGRKIERKFRKDTEKYREESAARGEPFPDIEDLFVSTPQLKNLTAKYQKIEISELNVEGDDGPHRTLEIEGRFEIENDLEIRLAAKGRVSMAPFAQKIDNWLSSGAQVVVTCSTRQQADRLREILSNYDVHVGRVVQGWHEVEKGRRGLTVCLDRLTRGFAWPELGLYVVSEDEIFGTRRAGLRRSKKKRRQGLSWSAFSQLKAGDLVVHEEHGIGRYMGLSTMEIAQRIHDFVIVEYAAKSKLYLPADRVSVLQKYAGAEERGPKLDQLGGHAWALTKQKAKNSVKKIAKQLVELYALRKYKKGFRFSPPDPYFREFESAFEHEETDDQSKAIDDVLADLSSDNTMDRLICGDVGFGKTEIAIRAAFKVVSDGKQVAFLVPTTVLAEQHFETFKKRMAPHGVSVGILSRFKTKAEQTKIVAEARSGKINILIGTHRILQKDVGFADLGLVIIDEEQRFGVKQKEALKKYRALVDVLAITATPVPRTLQMSMMGVRDLSVIETPPRDRLSIETYLSPYDEATIKRAIHNELERGGQTFFVHNKVKSIAHMADQLKQLVPKANLEVAHGQMKPRELENAMMRFLSREIDVLVCTTIIESGLDIPSANTIIINEADRLGLAQIYQLRGRVGRASEKAYAYLLISKDSTLTRDAEKRLKALMDFSNLGAGLHLAMHDLKIRGGGNILGFSQSGHISAVGYELYLRLIERTVTELKGEQWQDEVNPEININIPAFLPSDYIMDTDVRLNLYRRLSMLIDNSELDEMIREIHDRFGNPPPEVKNLLAMMTVRLRLKQLRISKLDMGKNKLTLTFLEDGVQNWEHLVKLADERPNRYRFLPDNRLNIHTGLITFPKDLRKVEQILDQLTP